MPPGTPRARAVQNQAEIPLDEAQRRNFAAALLSWYRNSARDLPWRREPDPYRTWVSEIMLQQTRVNAVLQHFRLFTERFPTVVALALAPEDEVLALWSGLGYYRRARMLHRAAKFLVKEHSGFLPRTAAELRKLPGIGNYTAAAIASIAFSERIAVVDGNVERVLLRVAGLPEQKDRVTREFVGRFAQSLVDAQGELAGTLQAPPGDYNQALMELGATICTPRRPRCLECPVLPWCITRGEHPTLERPVMKSERVAYALTTRNTGASRGVQVLLHRRDARLSLMPDMLELPTLHRLPETQPILRLRHAIVGTNFYAEVFGLPNRRELQRLTLRRQNAAWFETTQLPRLPLTGFTRKVLQRIGLMTTSVTLPVLPFAEESGGAVSGDTEAAGPGDNGSAVLPFEAEENEDGD